MRSNLSFSPSWGLLLLLFSTYNIHSSFCSLSVIVHQTNCDNKNLCTLSELGLNQRAAEPNINYAIAVKGQLSTPHYHLKMADLCLASLPLITTAGKPLHDSRLQNISNTSVIVWNRSNRPIGLLKNGMRCIFIICSILPLTLVVVQA